MAMVNCPEIISTAFIFRNGGVSVRVLYPGYLGESKELRWCCSGCGLNCRSQG